MFLMFISVCLPFVSDACCVNTDDYRYFVRNAGLEEKVCLSAAKLPW